MEDQADSQWLAFVFYINGDCSGSDNKSSGFDHHVNSSTMNRSKLKILILNCCSLQSSGKQANLIALIAEHNPDIIDSFRSHLDDSYSSAEIFPSNYIVLRKDWLEGTGGVFLCVNEGPSVSEESELDVNVEIVWVKVTLPKEFLFIYVSSIIPQTVRLTLFYSCRHH